MRAPRLVGCGHREKDAVRRLREEADAAARRRTPLAAERAASWAGGLRGDAVAWLRETHAVAIAKLEKRVAACTRGGTTRGGNCRPRSVSTTSGSSGRAS